MQRASAKKDVDWRRVGMPSVSSYMLSYKIFLAFKFIYSLRWLTAYCLLQGVTSIIMGGTCHAYDVNAKDQRQ
jgi:hypothetical protein